MAIGINPIPVTIANGQALSGPVALGEFVLTGIAMPAAWTAAGLSFQVSIDGGTTWLEMQSISPPISSTAPAGQFIAIDPTLWRGINMIQVRSGPSGSPVAQGADRA